LCYLDETFKGVDINGGEPPKSGSAGVPPLETVAQLTLKNMPLQYVIPRQIWSFCDKGKVNCATLLLGIGGVLISLS